MEIVNFSFLNPEDWRIVKQIHLEKTGLALIPGIDSFVPV